MAKKVIIIDDSLVQVNILKIFFTKYSWEVYCAQNAQTGYNMIFDIAPDLIIVDALMPHVGGFEFIKMTRELDILSKIPIIVYSIIDKTNARFYISEDKAEYYLNKTDDNKELLNLANKVIKEHQVDETTKAEILSYDIFNSKILQEKQPEIKKIENVFQEEEKNEITIDIEKFKENIKNIYNFSYNDDKLIVGFFEILYPILKYNVFMISLFSYENNEKRLYFDAKDVLLSPVFQNEFKQKYQAEKIILFKKYAPNLTTITKENEFLSKLEFNFSFKDENIINISIWSKDKDKYKKISNLEEFKNALFNFFCARHMNKSNLKNTNNTIKKYNMPDFIVPFLNMFELSESRNDIYFGILRVNNYLSLKENNNLEDLDLINSKISQTIINQLEYTEQIYKNSQDEYAIMLFAKDDKHAYSRLNNIVKALLEIVDENNEHIEVVIGASRCMINEEFNVHEAKKIATQIIDEMPPGEKVIVK